MEWQQLLHDLQLHKNEEKAEGMRAYMRNLFPFLGIPTPTRRAVCKAFFKWAKKKQEVDWAFIEECWARDEREFQYIAVDYLLLVDQVLTPQHIPQLQTLVVTKSWWDTVDGLDGVFGTIVLQYPEVEKVMLEWSTADNFWLRRIAIDYQLNYKEKTNTELLAQIIINNFGQTEFFINKAIGWSLREYSKTNREWVRSFIQNYKDRLAPLSIREGSKYLDK